MKKILLIIFICCSIAIIIMEIIDHIKIIDMPDCTYISNYCTKYGEKANVKYIIKEPNKEETIEGLLSKINTNYNKLSNLVYWRMTYIIALIACLIIWIYCHFEKIQLKISSYIFIFIIIWFTNYWMRNFLDFHYYKHIYIRLDETIKQLKDII